jgi:hypothetical protein
MTIRAIDLETASPDDLAKAKHHQELGRAIIEQLDGASLDDAVSALAFVGGFLASCSNDPMNVADTIAEAVRGYALDLVAH